jgi:hypothetical protein
LSRGSRRFPAPPRGPGRLVVAGGTGKEGRDGPHGGGGGGEGGRGNRGHLAAGSGSPAHTPSGGSRSPQAVRLGILSPCARVARGWSCKCGLKCQTRVRSRGVLSSLSDQPKSTGGVKSPDPRAPILLNVSRYCTCARRPFPLRDAVGVGSPGLGISLLLAPLFLGV